MKQKVRVCIVVFVTVCMLTLHAFAITFYYKASSGYDLLWSDDAILAEILDYLFYQEFTSICDVSPYEYQFDYQVVISYDELASFVSNANKRMLNTSLYRNDHAGYWVAVVHDYDNHLWFDNDDDPRVLGNPNGYVYVAEIDDSGEDTVMMLQVIHQLLYFLDGTIDDIYDELTSQGQSLTDVVHPINGYLVNMQDTISSILNKLTHNGLSAAFYLADISDKLDTLINNQGGDQGGDQEQGGGGSTSSVDLSGVLADLETLISNQSAALELLQGDDFTDGILDYLDMLSSNQSAALALLQGDAFTDGLLDYLETLISNQSAALDLLQGDELTDGLLDYQETLISNQSAALDLLQGDELTDGLLDYLDLLFDGQDEILKYLTGDTDSLAVDLASIITALSSNSTTLTKLNGNVYGLLTRFDKYIPSQETVGDSIANIEAALTFGERSVGWCLNYIHNNLYTTTNNVGEIKRNIADIVSFEMYLQSIAASQSSFSQSIANISSSLDLRFDTVLANQQTLLSLLQAEGAFMSDISGILANQQAVLELLQEEGAFTTDVSGILDVLDLFYSDFLFGIDALVSNQESGLTNWASLHDALDVMSATQVSTMADLQGLRTDVLALLNSIAGNQSASAESLATKWTSLYDALDVMSATQVSTMVDLQGLRTDVLALLNSIAGNQTASAESLLANWSALNERLDVLDELYLLNDLLTVLVDMYDSVMSESEALRGSVAGGFDDTLTQWTSLHDRLAILDELYTIIGMQDAIYSDFSSQLTVVIDSLDSQSTTFSKLNSNVYGILNRIDDGVLTPDLSGIVEKLASIDSSLTFNNRTVADYISYLHTNVYTITNKVGTVQRGQDEILSLLQDLNDLIEDLEITTNVTIENIENITIDSSSEAYEIFYITDSEGNEQNLGEFSGDVLTVGGRLLNFFFRVAFDDALDSVDTAIEDMTGFYLDDSAVLEGGSLWE